MVEILSIGMTIDHRTAKSELAYAALKLAGGGVRILHGEMGKSGIAIGPARNLPREKVVGSTRAANRGCGVVLRLHARTGEPKHRAGMPASSIAASRTSSKSVSRASALFRRTAGKSITVGFQYSMKSGQRKCSSSATFLTMRLPRLHRVKQVGLRSLYLIMDIRYKQQFLAAQTK